MRTLLAFLLLGASLFGSEPTHLRPPGYVGNIASDDQITQVHVINLLCAHGIKARLAGGTLGIYVEVAAGSETRTIDILRRDAAKRRYFVQFGDSDMIADQKPRKLLSRVSFKSALRQRAFSHQTTLGRFLRRRDINRYAVQYPIIDYLEATKRHYLANTHTLKTAYKVQITLRIIPGKADGSASFGPETFCIQPDGSNLIEETPL